MEGSDGPNLLEQFGKAMSVVEVAEFLKLSPASVRKHARELGGIEVIPGKLRFFQNILEGRLHAQLGEEERRPSVARQCDGTRQTKPQVVSGRQPGVQASGDGLGGGGALLLV